MTTNKQLAKVYNDSEIICTSGFTMQSRFILPMLSRMVDEKIINISAQNLIQAILSYKHTEENPYPTREELARYLGKSVDYVKKALKSIKEARILNIEKTGRKSTYSFKPFFTLLEKFIVEMKEKKNFAVKVAGLLKVNIQKKKKADFSWSDKYESGESEVVAEPEVETEEVAEETPEPVKPSAFIYDALKAKGIDEEGTATIERLYAGYSHKLSDKLFVQKIMVSADKKNFSQYVTRCLDAAFLNEEEYTEPAPSKNAQGKPVRQEKLPEWFTEEEARKARQEEAQASDKVSKPSEELEKEKAELLAKLATKKEKKAGVNNEI